MKNNKSNAVFYIVLLMLAIAVLLAVLTACGGGKSIDGKYVNISDSKDYMVFKSGGKVDFVTESNGSTITVHGTYTIKDKYITLTYSENGVEISQKSLLHNDKKFISDTNDMYAKEGSVDKDKGTLKYTLVYGVDTENPGDVVTTGWHEGVDPNVYEDEYDASKDNVRVTMGTFKGTEVTYLTEYEGFTVSYFSVSNCKTLTSVVIPNTAKSISGSAFYGCSALTSVTIPDSVKKIGVSAFNNCTSLTSITVPDSVKGIGERAFYACESLTSVTIPKSVNFIGPYAFAAFHSSLTTIKYRGTEEEWNAITKGENIFGGCPVSAPTEYNYTGE